MTITLRTGWYVSLYFKKVISRNYKDVNFIIITKFGNENNKSLIEEFGKN